MIRVAAVSCIVIGAAMAEIPLLLRWESGLLLILVGPVLFGAGVGGLYGRFRLGASLGLVTSIAFVIVTFIVATGQFRRSAAVVAEATQQERFLTTDDADDHGSEGRE